jgi:mono/diheme cytochrome c family protein
MVSKEFKAAFAIFTIIIAIIVPVAISTKMQPQLSNSALSSSSAPGTGGYYYANFCVSCHGPLASSAKLGRTAPQITAAISSVAAMNSLSSLNASQIEAIADALANPSAYSSNPLGASSPPPGSLALAGEGASVYAAYCAGCHGPLATSAKLGRSEAQISAAISSVNAMSSLSSLTASQIQAVAAALANPTATPQPGASIGPTPAPATMYAIYCASCHGPLSGSSVGGASTREIIEAISETRAMNNLSLTVNQIQAIASALQATGGGTNGNDTIQSTSVLIAYETYVIWLAALALAMAALVVMRRKNVLVARLREL